MGVRCLRPPRRSAGLYHFAILYPSREHLAQALRHLLDVGWPIAGASDHGVSEAIYLADPEGNGIELYVENPHSELAGDLPVAPQSLFDEIELKIAI